MKPRRKRVRIQAYVEPEVAERLAERLAASGVTESGLLRSSVLEYLDEMSDRILILRRLDRMGRAMERLQRELEFVAEGAAVFYLTWFCNTGAVPADQAGPAATSGEARYRRFMELVARRFASGGRFLDELPKELLANDDELDAVRERFAGVPRRASQ
jgi:hypothetical protein